MDDYALVLNAGSSSLKFCVFRAAGGENWRLEARGQIEGIGTSPRISAKDGEGEGLVDRKPTARCATAATRWMPCCVAADRHMAARRVVGVGHRVVHGGARFTGPDRRDPASFGRTPQSDTARSACISRTISQRSKRSSNACPTCRRSLASIRVFIGANRQLPNWFRCRAKSADAGVQRYGFHGLSYEYIASVLPQVAPEIATGRVIVAHLGSGASLCALKDGKSVDSTFGFTALDGLCMGTRPGAIDPGVVSYLFQNLGLSAKEVETILYKKSGLLGISGISNDMRDLLGQQRAREPAWQSTTSSIARPKRSARSPQSWAESTAWYSPPASERTPPKSASESASLPHGSVLSSTPTPMHARVRGSPLRQAKFRPG